MKSLWFKNSTVAAASVAILMTAGNAMAAANGSATSVASAATSKAAAKKEIPINLKYTLDLYGTQLTDITSDETTDNAIDAKTAIVLRHRPELKYTVNKDLSASLIPDFNTQLTDPMADDSRGFSWNDSYVKISRGNLAAASVKGNNITLNSALRLYAPTSKGSRDNKTVGSAQLWMNPTVQFGKSAFSLDLYNFAQYYVQTEKFSPKSGSPLTQMRFYTAPQLNYAFNDNVSAYVLYDNIVKFNTLGQPENSYSPTSSQSDVEPGMSIQVSKAVNLSPYINWYTNQSIKTSTINLNASIDLM